MESIKYAVAVDGREIEVEIHMDSGQSYALINEMKVLVDLKLEPETGLFSFSQGDKQRLLSIKPNNTGNEIYWRGRSIHTQVDPQYIKDLRRHIKSSSSNAADGIVKSHMPGLIVKIEVAPGQRIEEGDGLLIIEAMKMENEIRAPISGVVASLTVSEGEEVAGGATLCILKTEESDE